MIPSLDEIDRFYEVGKQTGSPIRFAIFDKRVSLPITQLCSDLTTSTGEQVSESDVMRWVELGWTPLFNNNVEDGPRVPLYSSSRINFLLSLQSQGWSSEELTQFASHEDSHINEVLTVDEFSYDDDDLATIQRFLEARVGGDFSIPEATISPSAATNKKRTSEQERERRFLERVREMRATGTPTPLPEEFVKLAFRIRFIDESLRVNLVEWDRAKLHAGYSHGVAFHNSRWSSTEGFKFEGIDWQMTLRNPWINDDGGILLRLPRIIVREQQITLLTPLPPTQYRRIWEENNLEGYFQALADLRQELRCLHCLSPITKGAGSKRYCNDKCRNSARQKRHRERNPDATHRAQQRYWSSLSEEG